MVTTSQWITGGVLVSFEKPNGAVTTETWRPITGKLQSLVASVAKRESWEREPTLTDRVSVRTLAGARMPRQKSVGIEPEGEIFLLTFLFIGPSELVGATLSF
jgi:hypothetical protein